MARKSPTKARKLFLPLPPTTIQHIFKQYQKIDPGAVLLRQLSLEVDGKPSRHYIIFKQGGKDCCWIEGNTRGGS